LCWFEPITAKEFLDYARGFAAAYESIWLDAFASIEQDTEYDIEVFQLNAEWPDAPEDEDDWDPEDDFGKEKKRFTARFVRWPGWNGFRIEVFEHFPPDAPENNDLPDDETAIKWLDNRHFPPDEEDRHAADDDGDGPDAPVGDDS
jgi:hypothetical protein